MQTYKLSTHTHAIFLNSDVNADYSFHMKIIFRYHLKQYFFSSSIKKVKLLVKKIANILTNIINVKVCMYECLLFFHVKNSKSILMKL